MTFGETFIAFPSPPKGAETVPTVGDLPTTSTIGSQRLALDTGEYYYWDGFSWVLVTSSGSGSGSLYWKDPVNALTDLTAIVNPLNGEAHWVRGEDAAYIYNGTIWRKIETQISGFNMTFNTTISGLIETGTIITNPSFTATYSSNPDTVTFQAPNIAGAVGGTFDMLSPTAPVVGNKDSWSYNEVFTLSQVGTVVTFNLQATTALGNATLNQNITSSNWVYYGSGAPLLSTRLGPTTTRSFLSVDGEASLLKSSRNGSYSINVAALEKGYFIVRTPFASGIMISIDGFDSTGDFTQTVIDVTNDQGFIEQYTVFETVNDSLGALTLVVT